MDVLSKQRFLRQVHLEKRRADRSRAPLSVLVMRFNSSHALDLHDLRDILTELSLSTRETDLIGHLNDDLIAFLLPYSDERAAEAFSRLIVARIEAPQATTEFATYPGEGFDALLRRSVVGSHESALMPHGTRHRGLGRAVKRLMDISGSLLLMILASPLMAATAIAVKLTSPGPVIFRQQRVGRDGVPFTFYKFRSMRVNSDDRVHREYVEKLIAGQNQEINQGDATAPVYKMKSDPRITGVGRIIRKTSIDELPQLFNVLKGEMSLVGPRPPIPYEAEKYQSWHRRRLQEVRPGITGLWQVEGRSKTTFDEMVRLDLRYVRNWSVWLDIKILFRTVVVVLRTDGAD